MSAPKYMFKNFQQYRPEDRRKLLEHFITGLHKGEISPTEMHFGILMEDTMKQGKDLTRALAHRRFDDCETILESAGATDTSTFRLLTAQLARRAFDMQFNLPDMLADKLTTKGSTNFINGEVVPGVAIVGNTTIKQGIKENEDYPTAGPSEMYYNIPPTVKFGLIMRGTREMFIADQSGGQIMNAITESAQVEAYRFERYVLRTVLGIDNTFKFNGTAYNTYADNSTAIGCNNLVTSNSLSDWQSWQNVLNAAAVVKHPINKDLTGVYPSEILIPHQLVGMANIITSANTVEKVDNQTNATTYRMLGNNPMKGAISAIHSSSVIYDLTGSATTWYAGGRFADAFNISDVWGQETSTRGMESPEAFARDTWFQWKVSRRSVVWAKNIHKVFKCTA